MIEDRATRSKDDHNETWLLTILFINEIMLIDVRAKDNEMMMDRCAC